MLVFGALAAMYFYIGVPKIYKEAYPALPTPHFYKNQERSISKIKIAAVYFVPKNKSEFLSGNWKEILEPNLKKLQEFHNLQFREQSKIIYEIYPEPIIGLKDTIEYDTENSNRGNPFGLLSISEEIERRVFNSGGDLFIPDFFKADDDAYPVLAIMYEGVGASGGIAYSSDLESVIDIARELDLPESMVYKIDVESVDGFFLINIAFLRDAEYLIESASLFSHEFYHTIGVPDAYNILTGIDTSQDIMGLGRHRLLEKTYLNKDTMKQFGL